MTCFLLNVNLISFSLFHQCLLMLDSAGLQTGLNKVQSNSLLPQRDATVSFPHFNTDNFLYQEFVGIFFKQLKPELLYAEGKQRHLR